MKIWKPIRIHLVEPLRDPAPKTKPGETSSPRPRKRPKLAPDGTSVR